MRDRAGKAIPAFEDSPQNRSQQAALSGRPLTESERTNASPELREVLARQDARTAQRSLFMTAATNREQGKGRSGGRGGR